MTILFADIKGFTNLCHEIPATRVMEFLNNLYSRLGEFRGQPGTSLVCPTSDTKPMATVSIGSDDGPW